MKNLLLNGREKTISQLRTEKTNKNSLFSLLWYRLTSFSFKERKGKKLPRWTRIITSSIKTKNMFYCERKILCARTKKNNKRRQRKSSGRGSFDDLCERIQENKYLSRNCVSCCVAEEYLLPHRRCETLAFIPIRLLLFTSNRAQCQDGSFGALSLRLLGGIFTKKDLLCFLST